MVIEYEGVVSTPQKGRVKVALTGEAFSSVEMDRAQVIEVAAIDRGLDFEVQRVRVRDDTVVESVPLDRDEFDKLFDAPPDWNTCLAVMDHQGRSATLDGSQFRCCYTIVYD